MFGSLLTWWPPHSSLQQLQESRMACLLCPAAGGPCGVSAVSGCGRAAWRVCCVRLRESRMACLPCPWLSWCSHSAVMCRGHWLIGISQMSERVSEAVGELLLGPQRGRHMCPDLDVALPLTGWRPGESLRFPGCGFPLLSWGDNTDRSGVWGRNR